MKDLTNRELKEAQLVEIDQEISSRTNKTFISALILVLATYCLLSTPSDVLTIVNSLFILAGLALTIRNFNYRKIAIIDKSMMKGFYDNHNL